VENAYKHSILRICTVKDGIIPMTKEICVDLWLS